MTTLFGIAAIVTALLNGLARLAWALRRKP